MDLYGNSMIFHKDRVFEHYFITRQPLQKEAKIRPFDSLNLSIWTAMGLNYLTMAISYVIIWKILKSLLAIDELDKITGWIFMETLFNPSDLHWQKIVKSGQLFVILMAFNLWTFNTLYGMNLRAALISQDFEIEINGWGNLSYFDTHFSQVHGLNIPLTAPVPSPIFLYMYSEAMDSLYINKRSLNTHRYSNYIAGDDSRLLDSMNLMQLLESPGNRVFITTRYVIQ